MRFHLRSGGLVRDWGVKYSPVAVALRYTPVPPSLRCQLMPTFRSFEDVQKNRTVVMWRSEWNNIAHHGRIGAERLLTSRRLRLFIPACLLCQLACSSEGQQEEEMPSEK